MNKRFFINILVSLIGFSALAVQPNVRRNNMKRAPVSTEIKKETPEKKEQSNNAFDEKMEMPTVGESWNKFLRLKWTSMSRNDTWNIGASVLTCGLIAYLCITAKADADINNNEERTCLICLDEKKGHEFCTLSCCGHNTSCKECLQEMMDASLKQKRTTEIKCPNQNCARAIGNRDVARILRNNATMYKTYNDVTREEWFAKHGKHCPTPDCTYAFINKKGRSSMTCPECRNTYCANCLQKHPTTMSCDQAGKQADDAWKRQNTKKCPKCRVDIQKGEGCNHMTCSRCSHEFCWICLNHWGTCRCPLYPADANNGQQPNNPVNVGNAVQNNRNNNNARNNNRNNNPRNNNARNNRNI